MGLNKNILLGGLRQKPIKTPHLFSESSTWKTDTVINRIKTVGTCKLRIENTYGRKQNKALSDILSPHIPYKNLEYEQKEKI